MIYHAWKDGALALLSCQSQLDELRATLRKPSLAERIRPHHARNAISFAVDGRTFKIQQVTGTLANLETTLVIYLQFQLQNPDARERFLDALGKTLA